GGAQWYAMFCAALHPVTGNDPRPAVKIDFGPRRADRLAAARGAENHKLQRPRGNGVVLTQPGHESRQLAVRHRLVVLDRRDLARRWQHLIEMIFPSGRIRAGWAMAAHDSPIDDLLDPASGSVGGDGFRFPQRLEG